MTAKGRLEALRAELRRRGFDGFLVPRTDEHQGEYVPPNAQRLAWLTGHGYVVASIQYRLSGEAIWPAQIHDCKAAIRFLRANAARLGYDATRVGVGGSSAEESGPTRDSDRETLEGSELLMDAERYRARGDWEGAFSSLRRLRKSSGDAKRIRRIAQEYRSDQAREARIIAEIERRVAAGDHHAAEAGFRKLADLTPKSPKRPHGCSRPP